MDSPHLAPITILILGPMGTDLIRSEQEIELGKLNPPSQDKKKIKYTSITGPSQTDSSGNCNFS